MVAEAGVEPTTAGLCAPPSYRTDPRNDVERVFRIELKSSDWKSEIIPLYDTRVVGSTSPKFPRLLFLKDIDILLLLQRYRMPFVLLSQIDILLQYPYLLYAHST